MTTFQGHYFDGQVPENIPAQMVISGAVAAMTVDGKDRPFETAQLRVSPRISASERFILLPDGGQFVCPDDDFFDSLPQESWSEGPVAWLEARWWAALVCIALVVGMLLVGHFYGLPAAANRIVAHIPMETERALGEHVLTWMEDNHWVATSRLDVSDQEPVAEGFERLIEDLPNKDIYELWFYDSGVFGANAFAFPGGIIVVTDDLVNLAESTEEVLAVLAHEIGHVEGRHMMKGVLQQSALAVVITAITSDASTLSAAVTGLPMVLAQMKYSRNFETAADDFAFELLKRKGYSPAAFATIMERLAGVKEMPTGMKYLSSHPLTEERARKAREADQKE